MKIISCKLENFASYKSLEFDFSDKGLTLIHGPTGSGKSTLCDVVAWTLFGVTSKNGLADEVLPWTGGVTKSGVCIQLSYNDSVEVVRQRGGKNNDLYFYRHLHGLTQFRGKDLQDTQKLINNLLGINADLFLSGSYYHEFSQTAQFFQTTAKNRRAICEQLVDLSLPKKLQEKSAAEVKQLKSELQQVQAEIGKLESNLEMLDNSLSWAVSQEISWQVKQDETIATLEQHNTNFVVNQTNKIAQIENDILKLEVKDPKDFKPTIDALLGDLPPESEPCKECGTPKHNQEHKELLNMLKAIEREQADNSSRAKQRDLLLKQLIIVQDQKNTYLEQLQDLSNQVNPHYDTIHKTRWRITETKLSLKSNRLKENLKLTRLTDLDILSDVTNQLRSILIKNTILDIETQTNSLLSNHFDAELRISLTIEDADKLEVSITKDGHQASFSQLSKGQRCMLKLTFGVAVMKAVANHHGVSFKQVWFDEALSGLDENLKLKACGLLEKLTLDYESVYFIEHSESVQAMIDQKYLVELNGGSSEIRKEG